MNSDFSQKRTTQANSSSQEKSVPKFLRKVFYMLENNQHNEYVSWTSDGAALVVKKPTEFAEEVLPCFFKHNNFASFVRQLNMYSFKKRKNYQYDHAYGHDSFQKGKIELLRFIQRKSAEGSQVVLPKIEASREQQDEERYEVESLLQENLSYKRIQKSLSTQFQFVERKVKDIKTEINTLYDEFHKQEAKEDFLKKVIKNLSERFGSKTIQSAVEQTMQESYPVPETSRTTEMSYEAAPKASKTPFEHSDRRVSYSRLSEPFELQKRAEFSLLAAEKRFNDVFANQDLLMNECSDLQKTIYPVEERPSTISHQGSETSQSDEYLGWYAGFEKKMHNPGQFLEMNKTSYRRDAFDDFDLLNGNDF